MEDFEGFKASLVEVTADVVEIARELQLEVEPELPSYDKILRGEEFLLMNEQRNDFLRWDLLLVKIL